MGPTFNSPALLLLLLAGSAVASRLPAESSIESFIAERNANEPWAAFDPAAVSPHHKGGCYKGSVSLTEEASQAPMSFTDEEMSAASSSGVSIDWREHGAVGPVQQQHPFGTCWAFSMTAVTEAISVIQGKNKFEKLSEQMTVSCTPPTATGDNSDVLWSWALHHTGGRYQTEAVYPYNRTCNSYRETQLAPDGKPDGYKGKCDFKHPAPAGPCPPCDATCRADGTPPCLLDRNKGFSKASVQNWAFISPHGRRLSDNPSIGSPDDVTRMMAALIKYGPAQIGIDATCVLGYTGGVVTNCTRKVSDQDHAVAIVGAGTDEKSGVDYWLVRNSWGPTFGEGGYFRMQRDTFQMGIFGGYYGCYAKDCTVDPESVQ